MIFEVVVNRTANVFLVGVLRLLTITFIKGSVDTLMMIVSTLRRYNLIILASSYQFSLLCS